MWPKLHGSIVRLCLKKLICIVHVVDYLVESEARVRWVFSRRLKFKCVRCVLHSLIAAGNSFQMVVGDRGRDMYTGRLSWRWLPWQSPRVYTTGDRRRDDRSDSRGSDRPVYTPYNELSFLLHCAQSAPNTWNSLPNIVTLTSCKSRLKTHPFNQA